jgi:lipid-binding SYLF domain-containing protein
MILNSDEAVKAFSRGGNVTIGGSISAAAGPIGTGGQVAASMVNPAPIFSYSRSKGEWALPSFIWRLEIGASERG